MNNALSIQDKVRNEPSAAVSFLVKFGCAISRARGKNADESRFARITFCESVTPGPELPFLGLANIEVSNTVPSKTPSEIIPAARKSNSNHVNKRNHRKILNFRKEKSRNNSSEKYCFETI